MQTQSPLGWKVFLSFWVFVSAHTHTQSQNHDFLHFTTREGLPSNYVYGVIEDDRGYIWAYTENGLAKYDGYSFQHFSIKNGLPGNDVVHALKDAEGKIWLWTYNNRPSYLYEDSIYIVGEEPNQMGTLVDGKVQYFSLPEKQHTIFNQSQQILLSGEVDMDMIQAHPEYFRKDTVITLPVDINNISAPPGSVYTISQDSVYFFSVEKLATGMGFEEGYLYVLHEVGQIFWRKGKEYKSFGAKFLEDVELKRILKIYQLGKDEKYLININDKQFVLLDILKESTQLINPQDFFPFDNKAHAVTVLDSSFLICFPEGFVEFDFHGNYRDSWQGGAWSNHLTFRRAIKDANGNIWQATREGGILMIPTQKRNSILLNENGNNDPVFEQLIRTKKGRLLGITDRGRVYQIEGKNINLIHRPTGISDFRSAAQTPLGILVSFSDGSISLKEQARGFHIENFENRFQTYFSDKVSLLHQKIWSSFLNQRIQTYHTEEKALYTASNQRIERREFNSPNKLIYSSIDAVITCIYYHPTEQKVYAGNSNGLFVVEKDSLRPIFAENNHDFSISSLYGTPRNLWIGTESKGAYRYNLRSGSVTKFCPAQHIRKIRPYRDSSLLIASNDGLWISSWENFEFENKQYDEKEGLASSEVLDVAWDGDQGIYAATTGGLNFINLAKRHNSPLSDADLQITSFQVNNEEMAFEQTFQLENNENNLHIGFHLMSHASNGKIRYFTRLNPSHENWRETSERSVNYFSLPPGDYSFELKAVDYFNNRAEAKPVFFRIKKAFWQTAWFITTLIVLFIYLVYKIFSIREQATLKRLLQEKHYNRRMADLELSALRAQMNPHFVFNALGAIQFYIQTHEVETADNYLTQFAKLMRKYLDSSKEKIISLSEEIELIEIYTELEKLRFEDLFTVELEVSQNIRLEDHFIPSMLIQPYIENAINHGLNERRDGKGVLQIKFTQEAEILICQIQDNGIGRENSTKFSRKGHKSRGMQIIKEKIQTLKNAGLAEVSIEIRDLDPKLVDYPGTQVLIRIKNLEYDPV